jgi:hypothetical protein
MRTDIRVLLRTTSTAFRDLDGTTLGGRTRDIGNGVAQHHTNSKIAFGAMLDILTVKPLDMCQGSRSDLMQSRLSAPVMLAAILISAK